MIAWEGMKDNNDFSNDLLVEATRPWFPLFADVAQTAMMRHLQAIALLGLPRKTERANDLHRAIRDGFRVMCDSADGLLGLVEEPEGQGLDYVVFRGFIDKPFSLRWGHWNGPRINRNATIRTAECQGQGLLFGGFDEETNGLPVATLGYTIEDDYTEAGIPAWWMGRLAILHERVDESEFVIEVARFARPETGIIQDSTPSAILQAREEDVARWERMVQEVRGVA